MVGKEALGALLLAVFGVRGVPGQASPSHSSDEAQAASVRTAPLAFEAVSVKPAPPGSFPFVPAFMRDKGAPILGLQTMAAPVWMTIGYAYHLQMSEALAAVRKQPDWVKNRIYRETFRVEASQRATRCGR